MAPSAMSWDIRGKRVLVTGATSGIGLEAARSLAKQGAKVVLVGRDAAKTARCLDDVRASAPGAEVSSLLCDFSRQAEVRRLADEVLRRYDRLDVLVNNAGTVFKDRTLTEAGIEATFAVNHLGYFLLTQLLLERLVASAPARIVNVASIRERWIRQSGRGPRHGRGPSSRSSASSRSSRRRKARATSCTWWRAPSCPAPPANISRTTGRSTRRRSRGTTRSPGGSGRRASGSRDTASLRSRGQAPDRRAGQRRAPALLDWGGREPAHARLPRPRMGSAAPWRSGAVREARARRVPGGAVLVHHPEQEGAVPRGLRRVRSGAHGALRPPPDRAGPEGPRHRTQPSKDSGRGGQCEGVARVPGAGRVVRHVPVELRRRRAQAERAPLLAPAPGAHEGVRPHERGAHRARVPLRRSDHLLRVHAGGGDGQRPPRHLLPLRGAAAAGYVVILTSA